MEGKLLKRTLMLAQALSFCAYSRVNVRVIFQRSCIAKFPELSASIQSLVAQDHKQSSRVSKLHAVGRIRPSPAVWMSTDI